MKPPEKMLKPELVAEVKEARGRTGAYKKLFDLTSEALEDIDELLDNLESVKKLRSFFDEKLK